MPPPTVKVGCPCHLSGAGGTVTGHFYLKLFFCPWQQRYPGSKPSDPELYLSCSSRFRSCADNSSSNKTKFASFPVVKQLFPVLCLGPKRAGSGRACFCTTRPSYGPAVSIAPPIHPNKGGAKGPSCSTFKWLFPALSYLASLSFLFRIHLIDDPQTFQGQLLSVQCIIGDSRQNSDKPP